MSYTLTKESIASQSFFSPIKLNYPHILTKQDNLLEVYKISDSSEICKTIQIPEPNQIYDYLWATSSSFLTLSKDHPLYLRSLETGKLIQKYPILSHLYEVKSPYCAFSDMTSITTCLGSKLFSIDIETGSQSSILIKSQSFRPRTVNTSILKFMNLVLIASHSNQVFLIDLNSGRLVSQIPSVPYISQILLQEQQLYIGGRAGQHIEVWDIKFAKAATQTASIPRFHPTHQKILFDVDSCFNLAIGHADGTISVLNRDFSIVNSFDAHFDAVNSVQFFCNGIVSSSGQRSIFPRESYSLIREFDFIIN